MSEPVAEAIVNTPDKVHVRSLDGLRFFAFLAVFLAHVDNGIRIARIGTFGVNVFFVLSGFLIGGILLRQKDTQIPMRDKLRTFYIRRILRIFPLYYAALSSIWILQQLHFSPLGKSSGTIWQIFYLTNLFRYFHGIAGPTSHFWSLAVEEQFYLIAPMILLVVRIKHIEIGLIWLWIFNALLYALVLLVFRNPLAYLLSNIQFGYLGIGVAAALIDQHQNFMGITAKTLFKAGTACVPICIGIIMLWMTNHISDDAFQDIFEWPLAVLTAATVLALWQGECRPIAFLLSFRPFVFLGQISYGLYVFHYPILVSLSHLPNDMHPTLIILHLVGFSATVLLATISWYLLERPINALKRFVPYPDK